MNPSQRQAQPFQTQDKYLAVTLATCGVQFPRDDKDKIVPFFNLYDAAILRKYGFPRGMPIEQAAREAHGRGLRGHLVYNFVHDELCDQIVKEWGSTSKAIILSAENHTKERIIDASPSLIARICCQFATNVKWFDTEWRKTPPCVPLDQRSSSRKERRPDGKGGEHEVIIVTGSFKCISLGLSAENRRKLKVK